MIRGLAAFGEGFAGGYSQAQSVKAQEQAAKDAENYRMDREGLRREGQMRTSTEPMEDWGSYMPDRTGTPASPKSGKRRAGTFSGDPYLDNITPHQKAFLNAVAAKESGGKYDIRYTPDGGATFEGFDQHPGIFEPGPHGPSSAAGRYQFTKTTWDDYGGGAFTPARQDMRALKLAADRYTAATGRDFNADLEARGLTREMVGALAPTWAAFKADPDAHIANYNASLQRYSGS